MKPTLALLLISLLWIKDSDGQHIVGVWKGVGEVHLTVSEYNYKKTLRVPFRVRFRGDGTYTVRLSKPFHALLFSIYKSSTGFRTESYRCTPLAGSGHHELVLHNRGGTEYDEVKMELYFKDSNTLKLTLNDKNRTVLVLRRDER